jgi:hypothetical protein
MLMLNHVIMVTKEINNGVQTIAYTLYKQKCNCSNNEQCVKTITQLVKKFPAFYGTRRFIIMFTRARHLSLS